MRLAHLIRPIGLIVLPGILAASVPVTAGPRGLQPAVAWYEVTKWQALAAREVARELGIGSIWSWGWEAYSAAERDPEKAGAACVWLWTRDPKLCNGPRAVRKSP